MIEYSVFTNNDLLIGCIDLVLARTRCSGARGKDFLEGNTCFGIVLFDVVSFCLLAK